MLLFAFTLTQTLALTLYLIILVLAYAMYIFWLVRIIKLQRQLRQSENVIRLKSGKIGYIVLAAVLVVMLAVFIPLSLKDGFLKECIIFSFLIGGLIVLVGVMAFEKCGITEEGIFTLNRFIPWSKLYDYYIDQDNNTIAFSNNVKGGLTLVGTTFPLKYQEEDTTELLAMLEAQKDRLLTNVVIR